MPHTMFDTISVAPPLELRQHPGGVLLSLARLPVFSFVELDEDIKQHDDSRSALALEFDGEASGDPWSAGSRDVERIADPQQGAYLAGERHICWFEPSSGRFVPLPGVQWHLAKALEPIAADGSGLVAVWKVEGGDHAAAALEVTAHDWLGTGADYGDRLIVAQHLQSRRWYFLALQTDSAAHTANQCAGCEVLLSASASPTSISSSTPVDVEYDEISFQHGGFFSLATAGATAGELTVNAAGVVALYHHDAAAVSGTPSGENLSEWRIQRAPPDGAFATIEDTTTSLHHPNLGGGRETKFCQRQLEVAHGDRFRVQASRTGGSDTLTPDTMSGGGPACFLGLAFLCPADGKDYTAELTDTSGDEELKLVGYWRLEEASGTRNDESANGFDLSDSGSPGVGSDTGRVGTAADFSAAGMELSRSLSGVTDFRPASERLCVAFWMHIDDLANAHASDFHQIAGLSGVSGWQLHLHKTSGLRFRVTEGFDEATTDYIPVATDKWYFVVAKMFGPGLDVSLRVRAANGSADVTESAAGLSTYNWSTPPGSHAVKLENTLGSDYIECRCDELAIWSEAVPTPGQENFLFAAGNGRHLL